MSRRLAEPDRPPFQADDRGVVADGYDVSAD